VSEVPGTRQPFLHDLVTCLKAPLVAISERDGQLQVHGAQGVYDGDTRVLSRLEVTVGGAAAEGLGHTLHGVGAAEFVGVLRRLGDDAPDPTVTLTRTRQVTPFGLQETLCLRSVAARTVSTAVEVRVECDLAAMTSVKSGLAPHATSDLAGGHRPAQDDGLTWHRDGRQVRVSGDPFPDEVEASQGLLRWLVSVPPRGEVQLVIQVATSSIAPPTFRPLAVHDTDTWTTPTVAADDHRLTALVEQGLADAQALLVADPQSPGDRFLAAGSPWFLTLFGRDSLWAARMMLPLGTELARGTLAALARRQGSRTDPDTGEQPGKILHEVREAPFQMPDGLRLPALYYGTVDATPLWVGLLVDAWRWGMPAEQVAGFLPACEAALEWMLTHGDSDGDGFLEYVDVTGSGLANQGWKDSGDSIQGADGRLATAPLALCEVQGYAYQAAVEGADLLEHFGRPGTDRWRAWAERLRQRFRAQFWTDDGHGPFPAVALDRDKHRVASLTSNIGHLLGTGLLDPDESRLVAARLAGPDMNSGYGLRTLSATAPRFGILSYHGGSVWPHDTAITVTGLVRDGHHDIAASLISGLLAAAPRFDYRLPELYSGTQNIPGRALLAYPAACRPQAWAATTSVALLQAVLGIRPNVPDGSISVTPLRPAVAGAVSVSGMRVAGQPLSVEAAADGSTRVDAPDSVVVRTGTSQPLR
jgi:glycogen debranching enzyme